MRSNWLAALTLLCISCNATAAPGDATPAPDRLVLEKQIAAILSTVEVLLPPLEEGGRARVESRSGPVDSSMVVINETTAFFEGCVMVVRTVRQPLPVEKVGWRQIDRRLDLTLVETDPESVRIGPPYSEGDVGSLTYQWRPEIRKRVERLVYRAHDILRDAMSRFPEDVNARLSWIAERHNEELVDKIYLDAGERFYNLNGVEITHPIPFPMYVVRAPGQQPAVLAELLHQYQVGYCTERL